MYFKKIFTPGLSHYSYIIGDRDEVAVIDPMRDIEVYIEEARTVGKRIRYIFETHRNEDYISGAMELSERTGAEVYISKYEELNHVYGKRIGEDDEFSIGGLKLKPLHTPGHTKGHLSYVLYSRTDVPYIVFVGDTLFWGDLGRSDFYGEDMLEEMTGQLHDSIFDKLFSLGDHVLMMPAHGAGSACGGNIQQRELSTIGYERITNPALQANSKEEFIEKHGYMRLKPPYFSKVEVCNVEGGETVGAETKLNVVEISELSEDTTVVDIRSREAYVGKHIPKSFFMERSILSAYLGWAVNPDSKIAFMADGLDDSSIKEAYWTARRMGYDDIAGVLSDGTIHSMEKVGGELSSAREISADEYLRDYKDALVLDVRREDEAEESYPFESRIVVPVQLLSEKSGELPTSREIFIVCRSGERSTVAYSILESVGINSKVVAGGITAIENERKKEKIRD